MVVCTTRLTLAVNCAASFLGAVRSVKSFSLANSFFQRFGETTFAHAYPTTWTFIFVNFGHAGLGHFWEGGAFFGQATYATLAI